MDPIVLAYVTAAGPAQAAAIGRALVEERLAACVNILPAMHSVYRWKGAIEEADESVLIAKCRKSGFAALMERVKALHTYEVPCILELAVGDGDPAYLAWLADQCDG